MGNPAKSREDSTELFLQQGPGCPSGAAAHLCLPPTGQPQVIGPTLNRSCFPHTICQASAVMTPLGGRGVFVAQPLLSVRLWGGARPSLVIPGDQRQFYSSRLIRSPQRMTT